MKGLILFALLLSCQVLNAQQFYILGGAQLAAPLTNAEPPINEFGYAKGIESGFRWTFGAEFLLKSQFSFEISNYNQTTTSTITLPAYSPDGIPIEHKINWLMIKSNKYLDIKPQKLSFFGGLGIGMVFFKTDGFINGAKANEDSFAWQAQTGIVYRPKRNLGVKLHGEYQMAVQGSPYSFTPQKNSPFSQLAAGLTLMLNMNGMSEKNTTHIE